MTHKQRCLDYLKKYGSISTLEAIYDLGNTRLSDAIYRLRKDGYIITNKSESCINRFGKKTYYDRYFLEEKGE